MATVEQLLDRYEPRLRNAFLAAIAEITDRAQIGRIVAALERNDIEAALAAVYVEAAAFEMFVRELEVSYSDGGIGAVDELGIIRDGEGNRVVFRFDGRNPEAERWLRTRSSNFITRIVNEQRESIREILRTGLESGDNPRRVALDVVGRVNRATGRRQGGIVGLSAPHARAVRRATTELQEGDYAAYLQRELRDKRFDRTVMRAERTGQPLTRDQISRITGRYADRLLKLRGDTIARTEMLASLHSSQYEALRQLVATGTVREDQVKRRWSATMDTRTRETHVLMNDQEVGLNEPFTTPRGAKLRFPGDPMGPPEEVINCRCWVEVDVDFLAGVS